MRFTTDVSVREPGPAELRVITTATVPEPMGSFPFEPEGPMPEGPFSALPPEPPNMDEWTPSWYDPTERVSPFIVSDTDL